MKPAARFAFVLLALVALAHLLRVVFAVEVAASGIAVPVWLSILAVIVFGAAAFWLWRES